MNFGLYYRRLVVAPLVFMPLIGGLVLCAAYLEIIPASLDELGFLFGGIYLWASVISAIIYLPAFALTWKWFLIAEKPQIESRLWLFSLPCLGATVLVTFGAFGGIGVPIVAVLTQLLIVVYFKLGMYGLSFLEAKERHQNAA